MNGYIDQRNTNSRAYINWKLYVAKHLGPIVRSRTVKEDMDLLQDMNKIDIGRYDVLKEIFEKINVKALKEIDRATERIKRIYPNVVESRNGVHGENATGLPVQVSNEEEESSDFCTGKFDLLTYYLMLNRQFNGPHIRSKFI